MHASQHAQQPLPSTCASCVRVCRCPLHSQSVRTRQRQPAAMLRLRSGSVREEHQRCQPQLPNTPMPNTPMPNTPMRHSIGVSARQQKPFHAREVRASCSHC